MRMRNVIASPLLHRLESHCLVAASPAGSLAIMEMRWCCCSLILSVCVALLCEVRPGKAVVCVAGLAIMSPVESRSRLQ